MKAIYQAKYGPPESLQFREIEKPVPKAREVLIKVYASTVNRTDCGWLRGKPVFVRIVTGIPVPKNKVTGTEFAGEIEKVGKGVKIFKPGEKVFGLNEFKLGSHAEYMVMSEDGPIAAIPANTSYAEAAPICEGAYYALCDIRAAHIQKGQKVLVNGASGGIGSAAVQLAVYFGAEVTAVCGTKNLGLMKSLGATEVIDYTCQDFTKSNQKYDLVFDAVGKSSFRKCKPILKKRGIYISTELGYMGQNPILALITPLFGNKKVQFPIPAIRKKDVEFLKTLVEEGKYKPVTDRVYPFEQLIEAFRYVETGEKTGNVVIQFNHV
ncbi:MAG TPA: NAD(P)-dependent alcohol dehydrogenase [Bacteroidales bacterium]|nr:NAD(P)-dependent alcohol dehydrogenase [Bacteroidales bacterium]